MLNNLLNQILIKKNIYLPREKLDNFRFSLLKKQLIYAYENIPYYKSSFDIAKVNPFQLNSIDELSNYPIINKEIIRSNNLRVLDQKNYLLRRLRFHGFAKSHTSGSAGQPMWTHYDLVSWIRKKYISKIRARFECGIKTGDRIAIFEPIASIEADKRNRNLISLFPFLHFRFFSIFQPYPEILKKLQAFSPHSFYGPPSYFFRVAEFLMKNNYTAISVKMIFTSSEYLQENVRRFIEKGFNSTVFDIYGSTEFKEVAWECEKHEGYHINEDEVILEVLHNDKPASLSTIGNITITDLRNITMPLIRFQLNDKGIILDQQCSCGRTFSMMKPLAGRSSEYISLPDGEILSPYLFTTSIEKIQGLLQYQIIQSSKTKINVNVRSTAEDFRRIREEIKNLLTAAVKNTMEIDVEVKEKLDIEENGKFKVVRNLLLKES